MTRSGRGALAWRWWFIILTLLAANLLVLLGLMWLILSDIALTTRVASFDPSREGSGHGIPAVAALPPGASPVLEPTRALVLASNSPPADGSEPGAIAVSTVEGNPSEAEVLPLSATQTDPDLTPEPAAGSRPESTASHPFSTAEPPPAKPSSGTLTPSVTPRPALIVTFTPVALQGDEQSAWDATGAGQETPDVPALRISSLTPTRALDPAANKEPSETAISTGTRTATRTHAPTRTSTATAAQTATSSSSPTATNTATSTLTATQSPTITPEPTETPRPSSTPTASATVTSTPTVSATRTSSPSRTPTQRPSPTSTITPSPTRTTRPSRTPSLTPEPTETPARTRTAAAEPAETTIPVPTQTAESTLALTPRPNRTPTITSSVTVRPGRTPTQTAAPTAPRTGRVTRTLTATELAIPTATRTPRPTRTARATATFTPTVNITVTSTATATATRTATVTRTAIPTSTSTPTSSPSSTPTVTPSVTLTASPTETQTSTPIPTATESLTATALPTAGVPAQPSPEVAGTATPTEDIDSIEPDTPVPPHVQVTTRLGGVYLRWDGEPGTRYRIYSTRGSPLDLYRLVADTAGRQWLDVTAEPGRTYRYQLIAYKEEEQADAVRITVRVPERRWRLSGIPSSGAQVNTPSVRGEASPTAEALSLVIISRYSFVDRGGQLHIIALLRNSTASDLVGVTAHVSLLDEAGQIIRTVPVNPYSRAVAAGETTPLHLILDAPSPASFDIVAGGTAGTVLPVSLRVDASQGSAAGDGFYYVAGRVRNIGRARLNYPRLVVVLLDSSRRPVNVEVLQPVPSQMEPDGIATFQTRFDHFPAVTQHQIYFIP